MKTFIYSTLCFLSLMIASTASAWVISGSWDDSDDIVMDEIFLPVATWSTPAQSQMSDYNRIDTNNNSHPFRVNSSPTFSFASGNGTSSMGFLDGTGLNNEYGLTFASALAWAISFTSRGDIVECDVVLDVDLAWRRGPDDANWFQSTVLHELGHCRGLSHFNARQSMQNSGQSKYLRDEVLYMDDRNAIRQNSSTVNELDISVHNKWHDGSRPQWMSMSPTTLREGDRIDFNDLTVENRGSQDFGSTVEIAFYLSTNPTITDSDTRMSTASWASFPEFTSSTFDLNTRIPQVNDCGTYYAGAIVDPDDDWNERFEGNNSAVMTNGVPYSGTNFVPTPLTIRLAEDADEPNNSRHQSTNVSLPFTQSNLTVDEDSESDFYKFTLSEERKIVAMAIFDHINGDVEMELQNASGVTQASSRTSNDDEMIARILSPGTYYLKVYGDGAGSCNRYNLLILAADPSCGLGFEAGLIVPLIFMVRRRLGKRR